MTEQLDHASVMTSVILALGVLGPAAALAPEIIKGIKAVVTWLRRVGVAHRPATVTPWSGSEPTPLQVGGLADESQGHEEARAA
jgi:predicted PurR-regulated permease PerM